MLHANIFAQPASQEVAQYGLFETEFEAARNYNNPYLEVSFAASIYGPGEIRREVEGYWYEGKRWRLRVMPTAPGLWTYVTRSNDPGLDSLSGRFVCVPSGRMGILQVNPDFPYSFRLSEGAPFLWFGETSWCLMSNAVPFSDGTFQKYIDRRREQKFNGIHFVLGTGGLPSGTTNPKNEGGSLWLSQSEQRINPQFYKWMDRRMAYLDSVQMAVGFFITWSQHFASLSREQFERWERYLIARYAAYPLLYWVIVGEFDEAGTLEDYNYHGRVIASYDPYGHLITNHPNHHDLNNLGTNRIFAGQDWFGIVLQQLPRYPVTVSPGEVNRYILIDRQFNVPVVNHEFGYEDRNYYGKIMTADYVRKYAWSIMFGGGFLSYGHDKTIRTVDLSALESDGIRYLGYLYDFFEPLKWWELYPDPQRSNRGFCLSSLRPEHLVYLPENGPVQVDLRDKSGLFMAQWYDPMTGVYGDTLLLTAGEWITFDPPFPGEAVLHIFPNDRPILQVSPTGLIFEAIEQGPNPGAQVIQIRNAGAGAMRWTASKFADSPWLRIDTRSGVNDADVQVSVALDGLGPGVYADTIRFSAEKALNQPIDVWVELKVDSMPLIQVISPNGGEYWEIGSEHEIRWGSQRIRDSVFIRFSSDAGASWRQIACSPNVHRYEWTVPNAPSDSCLIMICDEAGYASDQSDGTFTIAVPLRADFSAEPLIGYPPLNVTFRDLSTGLIDRWHWDFGDGSMSAEQHPVHQFTTPGVYSICLTITGKTGEHRAAKSNYITVLERIGSDIHGSVKYFSQGQAVPNVILELVVGQEYFRTTSTRSGDYLFEAVPHGHVSLRAINANKANQAIAGIDAVMVLRYLAALQELSEGQKLAADVNRDRLITELDAQAVLSFLCFDEEQSAWTGTWRFQPDSCQFDHRSDTTFHWIAHVLGDVNGDWNKESEGDSSGYYAEKLAEVKRTQLKIGAIRWDAQGRTLVPILIAGLTEPLHSLILTITYSPATLKFRSAQTGSLWPKFLLESNGKTNGKVFLAMAGAMGCKSEGEVILLIFDSSDQSSLVDDASFQITRALMNDQPILEILSTTSKTRRSDEWASRLALHLAPNPFHRQTQIRFELPKAVTVELSVYNILGQRVRTLINGERPAGSYEIFWDGTDDQGHGLNSGVYFYQLRIKDSGQTYQMVNKMYLLK